MTRIESGDRRQAARASATAPRIGPAGGTTADSAEDIGGLVSSVSNVVETGRSDVVIDLDGGGGDLKTAAHGVFGPAPPPRAPRSTFGTVAEAEKALRRDFGVDLKSWEWSTEELSRIHETLSALGPIEREIVRGLELRRDAGANRAPTHGDGEAGAVFTRGDLDDDGERVAGAAITFYDGAFPSTGDPAMDRQLTMQVVLHEVGHALEGHPNGLALTERQGGARVAVQVARFENALTPDDKALRHALDAFPRDPQLAPLRRALHDWERSLSLVGDANRSLDARDAAARNAARAQVRAEAALAALPPDHPALGTATALVTLHGAVTLQQPRYLDGVRRRDRAEDELADKGVRLDNPGTPEDETLGALEQAFAELDVQTTPYGATAPVENFAEAYMLYKRDPATLRAQDHGEAAYRFFLTHFPP